MGGDEPARFARIRDLHGSRALASFAGLALLVLFSVLAVVLRALHDHVIVGDEARLAIQAFESSSTHPRLGVLTTASQYIGRDLNNPGPMQLYTLLPFVRVLGLQIGSWVYCVLVIGASIVLAWWATLRSRGWWAATTVAVSFPLLLFAANPRSLTHVLNDELVLTPMFACWVLAWAVANGDTLMLPLLAIVATFVVQTFVGGSFLISAPVVVAVAGMLWSMHRRQTKRPLLSILTTAAICMFLWAPPLWDELRGTRNLSGLLSFSVAGRGLSGAWHAIGGILKLPIEQGQLQAPTVSGLVTAVVGVSALAAAARRGLISRSSWPIVAVGSSVLLAACLTNAVTPPSDNASYHFLWIDATSWLLLASAAVLGEEAASRSVGSQPSRITGWAERGRWAAVALFGAVMAILALLPPVDAQREAEERAVRSLSEQLKRIIPAGESRVMVDRGGSMAGDVTHGIRAQLLGSDRNLIYGYGAAADASLLVVIPHPIDGIGDPVASINPLRGSETRAFPSSLARWADRAGPLTLTPSGSSNLTDRIDGSAAAICPEQLRREPDGLRDLPPESLALVVAENELASPLPPQPLVDGAATWRFSAPFRVYELPKRPHVSFDEPFLSDLSC